MSMPIIEHATITTNAYGRYNIVMNDGWVFYDLADYTRYTDDEGNPREPYPDEIIYSRAGYNYPANYDFSTIRVVAEADVPPYQIAGTVTPPTVTQ